MPKPETLRRKPEGQNPKAETLRPKPGSLKPKHQGLNPKAATRRPKPESRNPKAEILRPKPQSRNRSGTGRRATGKPGTRARNSRTRSSPFRDCTCRPSGLSLGVSALWLRPQGFRLYGFGHSVSPYRHVICCPPNGLSESSSFASHRSSSWQEEPARPCAPASTAEKRSIQRSSEPEP